MEKSYSKNLLISSGKFQKEENYWKSKLSGELSITRFPCDFSRFENQQFNKDHSVERFYIENSLYHAIMKISGDSRYGIFMMMVTGVMFLLSKYNRNEDIIIGTPVFKQDIEQSYSNDIIVLRNTVHKQINFKELLLQVKQTILEASKHMNFPFTEILKWFELSTRKKSNPLFHTMIGFKDIHESISPFYNICDIAFWFELRNESIAVEMNYDSALFLQKTVKGICQYFSNFLIEVTRDPLIKLSDIEIISEEEKKLLVKDLNQNKSKYPRKKGIFELFENQVLKKPEGISVVSTKNSILQKEIFLSYKELYYRAQEMSGLLNLHYGVLKGDIIGICIERSLELIIGILGILNAGGICLPIDVKYPKKRIHIILRDSSSKLLLTDGTLEIPAIEGVTVINFVEVNSEIQKSISEIRRRENKAIVRSEIDPVYLIYTSGSTGIPKGVLISNQGIMNQVFGILKVLNISNSDLLCHSVSFSYIVSIWQIFVPLLEGLKFYLFSEEMINNSLRIFEQVNQKNITILEIVPSILKIYLDTLDIEKDKFRLNSLRMLVLTGEFIPPVLIKQYFSHYNTTLINAYGQTENTDDTLYYKIPNDFRGANIPAGKPKINTQVYIFDNNFKLQPKGVVGELYVSGDGLANGYLNRVELTNEKIIPNPYESNRRIYRTGDLAKWIDSPGKDEAVIEILGRIDQQVKIRGNRVELGEIEKQLLLFSGIKNCIIIDREYGSGEKYLCAYFESNRKIQKNKIREYLLQKLPDYMIPAYYEEIDELPLTPNGKIDRLALPEPKVKQGNEYIAPSDEIEKKLCQIWADVLGIDSDLIGRDSNFFELGGHSLKATILISKLQINFNVKIPLSVIFKIPSIRRLAEYIQNATKNEFIPIKLVEKKEFYATSAVQQGLYFQQHLDKANVHYNMPFVVILEGDFEIKKLEKAFIQLVKRHESLRISFKFIRGELVQIIQDQKAVTFKIENYDSLSHSVNQENELWIDQVITDFVRPFNLCKPPLFRAGVIKIDPKKNIVLVDWHHIISDGSSNEFFKRELIILYNGQPLNPLKIQYKDYAEWLSSKEYRHLEKKQERYWLNEFNREIPVLNLPTDFQNTKNISFEGSTEKFSLAKEYAEKLMTMARNNDTTLFMLLLAIYNVMLSKLSSQQDIIVGTATRGRRHIELEGIIGMFANMIALRNFPEYHLTFLDFLKNLRFRTLKAFENQDYQFDKLVTQITGERTGNQNPIFRVVFSYNSIAQGNIKIKKTKKNDSFKLKSKNYQYQRGISKFDLMLECLESNDGLFFIFEYNTKLFMKKTIVKLITYFNEVIFNILKNPEKKIMDIEMISDDEKQSLIKKLRREQDQTIEQSPVQVNQIKSEYLEADFSY